MILPFDDIIKWLHCFSCLFPHLIYLCFDDRKDLILMVLQSFVNMVVDHGDYIADFFEM